jgi:hypothetical protein
MNIEASNLQDGSVSEGSITVNMAAPVQKCFVPDFTGYGGYTAPQGVLSFTFDRFGTVTIGTDVFVCMTNESVPICPAGVHFKVYSDDMGVTFNGTGMMDSVYDFGSIDPNVTFGFESTGTGQTVRFVIQILDSGYGPLAEGIIWLQDVIV